MFSPWKAKGEPKPELSLAPVAKRLSELLGSLLFRQDDTGSRRKCQSCCRKMKDGDVVLLENTRYRAEETKNGEAFSKELASLADVFVMMPSEPHTEHTAPMWELPSLFPDLL